MPAEVWDALGEAADDDRLRMVIATRTGCHLCQEAEAVAARVAAEGTWASVDVDQFPTLRDRFSDHVPVVWVDGRLLSYWTLSDEQLGSALELGHWPPPPNL